MAKCCTETMSSSMPINVRERWCSRSVGGLAKRNRPKRSGKRDPLPWGSGLWSGVAERPLVMQRRALRGIVAAARLLFHNPDLEAYRQRFRREALGIVAGLIPQAAAHHVFPRNHRAKRMNGHLHREVSAVDAQLFLRGKGKAQVLSRGVHGLAEDYVGRRIHLQRCGN